MSGPLDFDEDGREQRAEQSPPQAPPPARPPGASRYSWFIGVAVLLLLGLVLVNAIGTEGVRTGGPAPGDRLAPFAVPRATADTPKGANLLREASEEAPAACDVTSPEAINICELWREGPVVLALFPVGAERCRQSVLEQFERLAPRHRDVTFVAVGSLGDREELTRRRWSYPVGWDPDGAVFAAYGVVECPQITFVRQGGTAAETTRATLTDAGLEARVERLE